MSAHPSHHDSPLRGNAQPSPPTSRLAVAALICSAFLCCPAASIVGAILGLRALRSIRASGGTLGGMGMARLAMFIGVGGLLAQYVGMSWFVTTYEEHLEGEIIKAVEASLATPEAAFDTWWRTGDASAVDGPALRRFADEARARYGSLQRVTLTAKPVFGAGTKRTISAPLTFFFEHDHRIGGAVVHIEIIRTSIFPKIRVRELVISDSERGDLRLSIDADATTGSSLADPDEDGDDGQSDAGETADGPVG